MATPDCVDVQREAVAFRIHHANEQYCLSRVRSGSPIRLLMSEMVPIVGVEAERTLVIRSPRVDHIVKASVAMNACEDCGFVYESIAQVEIGMRLRHYGTALARVLSLGIDDEPEWREALRRRPGPETWSPLEYAGHVVDVLRAQRDRLDVALVETLPDFVPLGLTDRVTLERYNDRDIATVRSALAAAVAALADAMDAMTDDQFGRGCIYSWPVRAERTLAWLGRHTIHELRHHHGDISAGIAAADRFGPNLSADDETMLMAWLEHHRATLRAKCDGATEATLKARPVVTSTLSLLGLVRHMACVEQYWFEEVLDGRDVTDLYVSADNVDGDFDDAPTADVGEAFASWNRQCEISRRLTIDSASVDVVAVRLRRGSPVTLRWILIHMIEEYARHNGHADLLRELADGVTGE
jgi:uncharacterized damage-inducible protein DinB